MSITIILLAIAISFIKLGQGLEANSKHFVTTVNQPLILRGVFVAVILVPILFLFLILIFKPTFTITLAIICMAVSPAADLSARQVENLGGDGHLAEGVLTISALISILTTPLLLKFFELVLGIQLEIKWAAVIEQVAVSQFIPMVISFILRKLFPTIQKSAKYIISIASMLLISCFILIIIQRYAAFTQFEINAYLAIIVVTVGAFILGLLAGKNSQQKIALSIESSMRNPGLAFLIASANFSEQRVDLAMVPYLVATTGTIIICTLIFKSLCRHYNR